jgi:hypothetical protein
MGMGLSARRHPVLNPFGNCEFGERRNGPAPPLRNAPLQRILDWEFDQIIVGHGAVVENNGKEVFRSAFRWLLK